MCAEDASQKTPQQIAALSFTCVLLTWKSELWPCRRAGLRGATGLRLLQKWMPDKSGLWASSKPEGVCQGRAPRKERENTFWNKRRKISKTPQRGLLNAKWMLRWHLEKQTGGAGRKSVVSPLEYRSDESRRRRRRGREKARMGYPCKGEKTYEINFFRLFPTPLLFSRVTSEKWAALLVEGPQPAPINNRVIGAYGIT